jgi:hypothetical protein
MRKADVLFRVRGARFTDLNPDDVAAFLSACAKLLGNCTLVHINAQTVALRRRGTTTPAPIVPAERTP